jgi:predicted dehydrogenase
MIAAMVGVGNWGYRLVPKLLDHASVKQLHCHDIDATRLEKVGRDFPSVKLASDYDAILRDSAIDAVVIATPVASHYALAKKALESGKHVLLEKPLTNRADHAKHLVGLAAAKGLVLMVDHITVYSGAAQRIKTLIDSKTLGAIVYFNAARMNLGKIQADVSVVWDLAVHEFALIDYLFARMPRTVSANGAAFYGAREEIADVILSFEDGMVGHVHVSWLSPVRRRELIIGGKSKMIVFDDTVADEKLKLCDRGVDRSADAASDIPRFTYRDGNDEVLDHDRVEPLVAVIDEFMGSVSKGREPLTSGVVGLRCVQILEAVDKSLQANGMSVKL